MNPISEEDFQTAKLAIENMSYAFEDLVSVCKSLDKFTRQRLFNSDTFGPISQFLGIGNGYEPAYPGHQFISAESLLQILEENTEPDDDEFDNDVDCIDEVPY